jgi:ATP-binding protein involved in chromosome partitioning
MGKDAEARADEEALLRERMGRIERKIAVISGKGGVGKSIVTANLAVALAWRGHPNAIGVLDADLHGPSIPKLLGMGGDLLEADPEGIRPAEGPLGIRVASMAFLLPSEETPAVWRGPLKMKAIRQFLSDVIWGDLDYLLIDLPPGTGDEPLSVLQLIPDIDGVIVVTIPSEVSEAVVKKSITFARMLKAPIIGLIENMSGLTCPHCGREIEVFSGNAGERIAEELNVPLLGRIPLDPRISEDSDRGIPFVVEHRDTPAGKAFMEIVDRIEGAMRDAGRASGPGPSPGP